MTTTRSSGHRYEARDESEQTWEHGRSHRNDEDSPLNGGKIELGIQQY